MGDYLSCHQTITQTHPRGDSRVLEKNRILKKFYVPLNSLHNSNFGASGGPWLGLHGPSSHYVGLHGCSSTCLVTK